jgi:hypothetical protein
MNNYYIYKLNVLDEFYIGSTKNPVHRIQAHKRDYKKENKKNQLLYKKMNDCYDLNDPNFFKYEILEVIMCDALESKKKEQQYIEILKPTLNMNNAFLTSEKRKQYRKEWYKKRKERETPEERKKRLDKKKEWYEKNQLLIQTKERERHKNKQIKILKEKLKKLQDNIKIFELKSDISDISDIEELNLEEIDLNNY